MDSKSWTDRMQQLSASNNRYRWHDLSGYTQTIAALVSSYLAGN
jgi:hypothetical protein